MGGGIEQIYLRIYTFNLEYCYYFYLLISDVACSSDFLALVDQRLSYSHDDGSANGIDGLQCRGEDGDYHRCWIWYHYIYFSSLVRLFSIANVIEGIGFCFAKLLLSKGCNVVIGDLALRPEAQKLVDEYDGKNGKPRTVFVKTNVIIWDELSNLFDQADKEFGGAEIVRKVHLQLCCTIL